MCLEREGAVLFSNNFWRWSKCLGCLDQASKRNISDETTGCLLSSEPFSSHLGLTSHFFVSFSASPPQSCQSSQPGSVWWCKAHPLVVRQNWQPHYATTVSTAFIFQGLQMSNKSRRFVLLDKCVQPSAMPVGSCFISIVWLKLQ